MLLCLKSLSLHAKYIPRNKESKEIKIDWINVTESLCKLRVKEGMVMRVNDMNKKDQSFQLLIQKKKFNQSTIFAFHSRYLKSNKDARKWAESIVFMKKKVEKCQKRLEIENEVSYRTCSFMQFAEFWSDERAAKYQDGYQK